VELLLRLCTWRNLGLTAAVAAVICSAVRMQEYPRRWVSSWRYPPQGSAGAEGAEIMRFKEKRDSDGLARRHERVLALLSKAETDGFDVSALRSKADVALQLNSARYRRQAILMLAEIELDVPRKKVQYIPLYPAGDEEEVPADVPGRNVTKRRR
jgi:hypothetical protein